MSETISLLIKSKNGKVVNQTQLIEIDDIVGPIIPVNSGADSQFTLREGKKGPFSYTPAGNTGLSIIVVDQTVSQIEALSVFIFSANVLTQRGRVVAGSPLYGFNSNLVCGLLKPLNAGSTFSYQEDPDPDLVNYTVTQNPSAILAQVQFPSGGGGGGTAASVSFVPDGDISATNVQAAIVEVRDDTDDKLAGKQDALGFTPENVANKSTDVIADAANSAKYPNVPSLVSYTTALFVGKNAAITGATKTKITYDAKGLVTAGVDATTADINDSTNRRYVTDAQQTVISNTSGVNTGDAAIASVAEINTGTDNIKYTTAAGLDGSKYLDQSQGKISATASGTDTYTATLVPGITSYNGIAVYINFTNVNTVGNPTLSLNGLSADGFVYQDGSAINKGILKGVVQLKHNGTAWQIVGTPQVTGTWTLTWTGFSTPPTSPAPTYILTGNLCFIQITPTAGGTSNAVSTTVTLPFPAKVAQFIPCSIASGGTNAAGFLQLAAGSSTAFVVTAALANPSAAGGKNANVSGFYIID